MPAPTPRIGGKATIGKDQSAMKLSPAQIIAYEQLTEAAKTSSLVVLEGEPGSGKSTLVNKMLAECGGARVGLRELLFATANTAHPCIVAPLLRLLEDRLERNDVVIVDDFDLIGLTLADGYYTRPHLGVVGLQTLLDTARAKGKCVILTGATFRGSETPERMILDLFEGRMHLIQVPPFTAADVSAFLDFYLGEETAKGVKAKIVFDHAPGLNAHHFRQLCNLLQHHRRTDEAFIREMIDTRLLMTNANLGEVANIDFSDLKGFEDIVHALTIYVLNPLKNDARLEGIELAPKRGVLLYGPPGTGKTSVGRALARQMEGKFFLIDGTIPTEPARAFYSSVKSIFEAAKNAAPCVVFIDDADVLFQSDRAVGIGRYLLTMLDGLESKTSGKVAVIMTAMDPNHLPPALLRSGRVELWLETKPPSEEVRAQIVAADAATLPREIREYDFSAIGEITEGFNAADMRRLVADVKALYARDVVEGRDIGPARVYFEVAAKGVRRNRDLLRLLESGRSIIGGSSSIDARAAGHLEAERLRP